MLDFGSWDHHLAMRTGFAAERCLLLQWTFTVDDEIVAAPASAGELLIVASSNGSVSTVSTGRQAARRWYVTSFSRLRQPG